jgi:hypothetical protein
LRAVLLGPAETSDTMVIVQTPWGSHWTVRGESDAAIGADVSIVADENAARYRFDCESGARIRP